VKQDGRPRHQQIAADLRALIMAGDLSGKLPTTAELMERYGVGSPTVQHAIQLLKDEGFAKGRRGSGVYTTGRVPIDTTAYVPAEGGYSYELLDVAEVVPPVAVADAFGGAAGVIMRYRLMRLDGAPVELSWSYYPLNIATGTALSERRRIKGGAAALLGTFGFAPARYEETVSARLPTTAELEVLELPDDVPVLRHFRVLFTADGLPVEATVMIKGGHRFEERVSGRF
jgi:GntR family transcriptional regulator